MKWKLIKTDGAKAKSRHGHRAVAINDGIIIYGGGKRAICKKYFFFLKFSFNFSLFYRQSITHL